MNKRIFHSIINFPVWLIKGLRDWFLHGFRNIHMSMRRRITVDYITIYIISGLVSVFFVPVTFTFFEIGESVYELSNDLNQYFYSYQEGTYDYEELEVKINQIFLKEGVSVKVDITEEGNTRSIITGNFESFSYPSNPIEYMGVLIKENIVPKNIYNSQIVVSVSTSGEIADSENELDKVIGFNAYGLYPFHLYLNKMLTLLMILLIFYSIGLLFMVMLGGARVRNVLSPIYHMTKTAEQVSMSNLNLRLDVETTKYELKDLAITLNEMLDRLDKDYSKQKRFVSDVSHELRTPISIVNGYASMLERWGKEDEEILVESIDAIKSEALNMQSLVENLLTLVRNDNQTLTYEASEFNIGEMLCNAVKEFNMVNNKNQYITCEAKEDIMVYLDEIKIKQSMRIFIDNAVKYTPENGGVQIKCYSVKSDVYIHVKDTGIGISKDDLPYLFDRFYRSDESRTRETGGHGLGLSIAKVMIIGHNGKIKVKSRIGKGSEFIIILPKKYVEEKKI